MRKTITLFFFIACTSPLFSQTALQKTWSNWMAAPYGLTFRNGAPQDFVTAIPPGGLSFPWTSNYTYTGTTAVAYADSLTGQIKFVATPTEVYNRNYDTVTNGYSLISCGSDAKNAVLVIPFPDGQNKFYIIHQFTSSSLTSLPGLQTRCSVYAYINYATPGVRYSVLDLDYNNGLGKLVSKNNFLPGGGGEQFVQIRHANGKDLWLIGHSGNSNFISKTLFNQSGVQGLPAQSSVFPSEPFTTTYNAGGVMDASPQGAKIAISSSNNKRVNIYNFNAATGDVNFDTSISIPAYASEVCFSPDGTKLYVGTYAYSNCGNSSYKLYQIDLAAADRQESVFELYSDSRNAFQMQRIVGNRILVFSRYLYYDNAPNNVAYHLLAYPNQPKNSCTLIPDYFISVTNGANMPNVPSDVVKQDTEAPISNFNFIKDTAVCFGTYTIAAPAGYAEYRWNNGQTSQAITVSKPGVYSVLAGPVGFTKPSAYGFTNVRAKSQAFSLGSDTLLCPKATYGINVPSGFSNILWQNGDTSHTHAVSYPGGLQVLNAVDANGCRVKDSVCVRINYYPRAEFGNDTTLCAGQKMTLHLEPTQLFNNTACVWQDGSSKDSLQVNAPGRYWGSVTYQGCTVSDTINVQYISPVTINLGRDTALCAGDSLRLSVGQANLSYSWNTGATTQSIVVKSPGTYIVHATNGQCTLSDTLVVSYNPLPHFSLGNDRLICPDESTSFTAPVAGTYLWSNGSSASSIQTSQPGLYWLQVTDNGCASRDSVRVTQKPLPVVNLGNDTTLCEDTTKVFDVYNTGATYSWFDGSTSNTYTVNKPATVSVTVTLNGCVKRDTVLIQYNKPPFFTLGTDTAICAGTAIVLQPALQNGNYQWQDGSSGKNFTVKSSGVYSLQVTNQCGSLTSSITVAATLCELLMPNAFTPNGDGMNDVFLIKYPQYLKNFRMTIYDRRGETLYETSAPGQGWDGTYKGKPMRTATYIWRINYTDVWGNTDTKWGTVTLIR